MLEVPSLAQLSALLATTPTEQWLDSDAAIVALSSSLFNSGATQTVSYFICNGLERSIFT